jgi:hypothetical protein
MTPWKDGMMLWESKLYLQSFLPFIKKGGQNAVPLFLLSSKKSSLKTF